MSKGIRIISDAERLVFGNMDRDGYEIYYRRIPNHIRNDIAKKHTKTGRRGVETTDWLAAGMDMLKHSITGWTGVYDIVDDDSVEIIYAPERVAWLPDEILQQILELSGANIGRDGGDAKNLSNTHVNKSETTD